MAKGPQKGTDNQATSTPSEFPQGTPRDLYPTSDIRFVMVEVGKLTANVEHLIADVKSQGDKLDEIRHQSAYIKGMIAAAVVLMSIIGWGLAVFLSSKWDAAIEAMKLIAK